MAPRKKFETVDEYIAKAPEPVRDRLRKMRAAIRESAPDAEEAIAYGMPAFRQNGTLVYFAAFSNHIGFYPTSSGVAAFEKELAPYKHAKGSVRKLLQWIAFRIEIEYTDYQFSRVGTTVEQE